VANFESFDGLPLYYDDQGDGRVVVLLHGFAADTNVNYVRAGIFDMLLDEGYRVVVLDARGHGLSSKPTDPDAYADDAMRRDVQALLDHLRIEECMVVGYSMGGHTALRLAPEEPRVRAMVLLGVGENAGIADGTGDTRAPMVEALRTDDPDTIEHPALRRFRVMAGLDREPLVALMSTHWADTRARVEEITVPVLLIVGQDDDNAGSPDGLLEQLPNASAVRVPGDHFTANARPELHEALREFLGTRG
jgi:pimeloyl-ACP methyl ester carboxylesterase